MPVRTLHAGWLGPRTYVSQHWRRWCCSLLLEHVEINVLNKINSGSLSVSHGWELNAQYVISVMSSIQLTHQTVIKWDNQQWLTFDSLAHLPGNVTHLFHVIRLIVIVLLHIHTASQQSHTYIQCMHYLCLSVCLSVCAHLPGNVTHLFHVIRLIVIVLLYIQPAITHIHTYNVCNVMWCNVQQYTQEPAWHGLPIVSTLAGRASNECSRLHYTRPWWMINDIMTVCSENSL